MIRYLYESKVVEDREMSSSNRTNATVALNANYQRRVQNARNSNNYANRNELFFFNRGIRMGSGNEDLNQSIHIFENLFLEYGIMMNDFLSLSLHPKGHYQKLMQNYGSVSQTDANQMFIQLYQKMVDVNQEFVKIMDKHVIRNGSPLPNPANTRALSSGGYGAVYEILNQNNVRARVTGKECLLQRPKRTIIKIIHKNVKVLLFNIFLENYIQNTLYMYGPKVAIDHTDGSQTVMNVIPRPTCIRKMKNGKHVGYMERSEGSDMFTLLDRNLKQSPPNIRGNDLLLIYALDQLSHHLSMLQINFNFLHNDLNHNNIMILPTGHVQLIDFGMSVIQRVSPIADRGNPASPNPIITLSPSIDFMPMKYKYNSKNWISPLEDVVAPYGNPDIFSLIYHSQDLFYFINFTMIENMRNMLSIALTQNQVSKTSLIDDQILQKLLALPGVTGLSEQETKKIYFDNIRNIFRHDWIYTIGLHRLIQEKFYTYHYSINGSGNQTYNVLEYMYKLYIDQHIKGKPNIQVYFSLNRPGNISMVDDVAVPICEEILSRHGIHRPSTGAGGSNNNRNMKAYHTLLYRQVEDFIRQFRSHFLPNNVKIHVTSILGALYPELLTNPTAPAPPAAPVAPPAPPAPPVPPAAPTKERKTKRSNNNGRRENRGRENRGRENEGKKPPHKKGTLRALQNSVNPRNPGHTVVASREQPHNERRNRPLNLASRHVMESGEPSHTPLSNNRSYLNLLSGSPTLRL